jgi:hypothetical protein
LHFNFFLLLGFVIKINQLYYLIISIKPKIMNRYLSLAGSLLTIASVFLPIMSLNFLGTKLSISLWKGGEMAGNTHTAAVFLIICGVIAAAIALLNKRFSNIVNILVGLIVFVLGLKYWSDMASPEMKTLDGASGIGTYLLLLGGLLILVGAIMGVAQKKAPAPVA